MTRLIVKPLNPDEPGSYRERAGLFRAIMALDEAERSGDMRKAVAGYVQVENLILPRLHTDDGSLVEDVLGQISANEFDQLLRGLAQGGEKDETVPPANASS